MPSGFKISSYDISDDWGDAVPCSAEIMAMKKSFVGLNDENMHTFPSENPTIVRFMLMSLFLNKYIYPPICRFHRKYSMNKRFLLVIL